MRHRLMFLSVVLGLIGALTGGAIVTAQEGSPPPGGFEIA